MRDLLNKVTQGDCLEVMRKLPESSVDLIVIDPPYNIGKDKRWDKWRKVGDYVAFMTEVFKECERILKSTGSFYWFHNDMTQIRRLIDAIDDETSFVYKQFIVWDKFNGTPWNQLKAITHSEDNRNYPKLAEYCVFYSLQDESDYNGATVIDNYRGIIDRIQKDMTDSGLTKDDVTVLFRQEGRYSSDLSARVHASYKMGWNGGKRFDLMDEKLYEFLSSKINWSFTYEELKLLYLTKRSESENNRYTFNVQKTHSSVWQYAIPSQNGHVTPKPVDLIENIIRHSSNEGDVVLDCFLGSGTTAVAAINTGRNFIGIEREPEYVEIANKRITEALAKN